MITLEKILLKRTNRKAPLITLTLAILIVNGLTSGKLSIFFLFSLHELISTSFGMECRQAFRIIWYAAPICSLIIPIVTYRYLQTATKRLTILIAFTMFYMLELIFLNLALSYLDFRNSLCNGLVFIEGTSIWGLLADVILLVAGIVFTHSKANKVT